MAAAVSVEESPDFMRQRCRVTPGGGNPRESATENRPPLSAAARVKRWGKSPPGGWQQTPHGKPHREQCRIGTARGAIRRAALPQQVRVGSTIRSATAGPEEWSSSRASGGQNPAYRPSARNTAELPPRIGGDSRLTSVARTLKGGLPRIPRGLHRASGPAAGASNMAKPTTIKIRLNSTAGTGHFYVTKKNARTMTEKMTVRKYDPVVRQHVEYKEGKIK